MISLFSWQAKTADRELLNQCKQAIQSVEPTAQVVLYGSRARGQGTLESDYDILALVENTVDMALRERLIEAIYPLELESGAVITLVAYNREQWDSALYQAMPFRKNVERDGVEL